MAKKKDKTPQLTISDLLQSEAGLGVLAQTKIPNVKATYRIGKAARQMQQELKPFYEERARIAKEMNVVDEAGTLDIKHENFAAFSDAVEELAGEPVDLNIHTVPLSWLDGVDLTPQTLMFLDWLIDDEEE